MYLMGVQTLQRSSLGKRKRNAAGKRLRSKGAGQPCCCGCVWCTWTGDVTVTIGANHFTGRGRDYAVCSCLELSGGAGYASITSGTPVGTWCLSFISPGLWRLTNTAMTATVYSDPGCTGTTTDAGNLVFTLTVDCSSDPTRPSWEFDVGFNIFGGTPGGVFSAGGLGCGPADDGGLVCGPGGGLAQGGTFVASTGC